MDVRLGPSIEPIFAALSLSTSNLCRRFLASRGMTMCPMSLSCRPLIVAVLKPCLCSVYCDGLDMLLECLRIAFQSKFCLANFQWVSVLLAGKGRDTRTTWMPPLRSVTFPLLDLSFWQLSVMAGVPPVTRKFSSLKRAEVLLARKLVSDDMHGNFSL